MIASKRFRTSSTLACASPSMSAVFILPVTVRSLTVFSSSPRVADNVPGRATSIVFVVCACNVQLKNTDKSNVNK